MAEHQRQEVARPQPAVHGESEPGEPEAAPGAGELGREGREIAARRGQAEEQHAHGAAHEEEQRLDHPIGRRVEPRLFRTAQIEEDDLVHLEVEAREELDGEEGRADAEQEPRRRWGGPRGGAFDVGPGEVEGKRGGRPVRQENGEGDARRAGAREERADGEDEEQEPLEGDQRRFPAEATGHPKHRGGQAHAGEAEHAQRQDPDHEQDVIADGEERARRERAHGAGEPEAELPPREPTRPGEPGRVRRGLAGEGDADAGFHGDGPQGRVGEGGREGPIARGAEASRRDQVEEEAEPRRGQDAGSQAER